MSLKKLHEEVLNETKKLLKTDISTNPHTLNSYKINLKLKFNDYILYIHTIWNTIDGETKLTLQDQIISIRTKVKVL